MRFVLEFNMPTEAIKTPEIRNILHNQFHCDDPMEAEELLVDFDMTDHHDCLPNLEKGLHQMLQQIGTSWETTFALVNPVGAPIIEGMETCFIDETITTDDLKTSEKTGTFKLFEFAVSDFMAVNGYDGKDLHGKKLTHGHIGSDSHVTDEGLKKLERDLCILDSDLIVFDFWYHGTKIGDLTADKIELVASLLEKMGYTDLKSYENRLAYAKIPQEKDDTEESSEEKLYSVSIDYNYAGEAIVVKATSLQNALNVLTENFQDLSDMFRYIVEDGKNIVFTIDDGYTTETRLYAFTSFAKYGNHNRMDVTIEELNIPTDKPGCSIGGYTE